MAKVKSRPQRWADAVTKASAALEKIESAKDDFVSAVEELKEIQQEYSDWKDNLPDNLQQSAVAEKLDTVCDIDLESASDAIDSAITDARSAIDDAEGADLPRGFGKD